MLPDLFGPFSLCLTEGTKALRDNVHHALGLKSQKSIYYLLINDKLSLGSNISFLHRWIKKKTQISLNNNHVSLDNKKKYKKENRDSEKGAGVAG